MDRTEEDALDSLKGNVNNIVIGTIYGVLLVIIIIHIIVRCELRRRRLNNHTIHTPGDKSFKHKKLRQIISCDIERVRNISSDVRLVDESLDPLDFGTSSDGSPFPGHWYRMKAFDESADFVTAHINYLKLHEDKSVLLLSPSPNQLPVNKFLLLLKEARVLSDTNDPIINEINEIYNHCRYEAKTFTATHYQRIKHLLLTLTNIISSSSDVLSSLPIISFSTSSLSTHHTQTTPLATPTTPQELMMGRGTLGGLAPATHSSVKRDSKGHRPPNLELAAMTTPTSATPTPGSSLFPWTDTRKLMPGTPV